MAHSIATTPLSVRTGDVIRVGDVARQVRDVTLDRNRQRAALIVGADEPITLPFTERVEILLCPHTFTDGLLCTMRAGHEQGHYRAHQRPILRRGWAAGSTDGGEWLTVWGSAYRNDLLYATREAAEERAEELRARSAPSSAERVTVAYVASTDLGHFRIVAPSDVDIPA